MKKAFFCITIVLIACLSITGCKITKDGTPDEWRIFGNDNERSLSDYHNMSYLYITCNPDNIPSRKTLEYLKGELLEIAELPEDSDMRVNYGDTEKCIFKFDL